MSLPSAASSGTTSPAVSVVVATRNRASLLGECLEAIARQRDVNLEVIVVDDGSDKSTRDTYQTLCPALADRLRWIVHEHPDVPGTGPAAARNRGIRAASGTFVAFCDDDDRWIREDHLQCAIDALETAAADFFFCNVVATRDGVVSDHVWFPDLALLSRGRPLTSGAPVLSVDLDTVLRVVAGTVIHPDCWVVRRTLLEATGGFWERLWFPEDYDLMMRILDRANSILFRPDACVDYRLPVSDSHSLRSSLSETILQENMAAQHVRLLSRRSSVRRHARAREAWTLRRLANQQRADGQPAAARAFAWQALCLYPTLGAVRDCLW